MKIKGTWTFILILLFIIPIAFSTPIVNIEVAGYVVDDQGNNLHGATISLNTPTGCYFSSGTSSTTSNWDGSYDLDAAYVCYNFPVTFTLNGVYGEDHESHSLGPINCPGSYFYTGDDAYFVFDNNPPVIHFSPYSHDWTNYLRVNISATDYSNVKRVYYKVIDYGNECGNSGYSSFSGSSKIITLSSNGKKQICAYGVDQYNNKGWPVSSGRYKIDTKNPTISTSITNGIYKGTNGWNIPQYCVPKTVKVSFTAKDQESGLKSIKYGYWAGSTFKVIYNKNLNGQHQYSSSFSFQISNNEFLYGTPTDRAGNSYSDNVYLKLDNDGPNKVTFTSYPQYVKPNHNYNIKWNAVTDNGCAGFKDYKVEIIEPNGTTETYTTTNTYYSFTPTQEGTYEIKIAGVDKFGNVGEWNSIDIISDGTPPTISFNPYSHDWINQNITVTISSSDNSGIKELDYGIVDYSQSCSNANYKQTNGNSVNVNIGNNGKWKICAKAIDLAGNVRSNSSGLYKVDKQKPTITILEPNQNLINSSTITFKWQGDDGILSGIDHYEIGLDTPPIINVGTNTSEKFSRIQDGQHTFIVKGYDKAGNSNQAQITFKIDTTPPSILFNPNSSDWTQSKVVYIEVSDSNGVQERKYNIINSSENCSTDLFQYHDYQSEIILNQNGQWKICGYAKDMAGNSKFAESGIYKIDNEKPYVGTAGANLPYYNGIYYSKAGLKVKTFAKVSDKFSGIDKCYYTTKYGQSEGTYNGTHCIYTYIEPSNSGGVTFWFKAFDKAGNSNNGGSATIKVDNQNPLISISTKKYWNSLPVEINWQMSDNVLVTKYDVTVDTITHSYNYNHQSGSGVYDINLVSNGNHYVKFKVYDIVNNTNEDSLNFCFDNQVPNLNLENPIISGTTVTFKWDTNDNGCSGINHSELYLDNNLIYNGTDTSYTKDVTSGDHTWKVIVYDNAGNSIEKNSTIHVDNTAPKVYLISPIQEYLNSNSITLKFKATDDLSNKMNCRVIVNNTEVWKGVIQNNTEKDIQISENDGYYIWKVSCTDDARNEGNSSSWFVVDTQKPVISISSPSSNSYLNINDIPITFTVSDDNLNYTKITIYQNGAIVNYTTTTDSGTQTVHLSVSSDGVYNITATAFDKAGNTNSDEKDNIIIDTQAPQTIINAVNNDGTSYDWGWTNQNVNVTFSVSDANPNVTYYKIDNGDWKVYNGMFSISTNENHSIKYYSIDMAENKENIKTAYIAIDKENPIISFIPNSQNWINHELNVNITGKDSISGVKTLYYNISQYGKNCPAIGSSSYQSTTSSSKVITISNSGKWEICAYAVDFAGNTKLNVSGEYKIDKEIPSVSIINPINNSFTNDSNILINWTGSDNVQIVDYKLSIDGNVIDVGTDTNYQTTLNEGTHNINVTAIDEAGNQNTSKITFTIDLTPPFVNITSPNNNSIHSGNSLPIYWNSDDNYGIDHFNVYLNGNFVGSTDSNSYSFDNLDDGRYVAKVVAFDKAGNTNESEITFYIDNTPPKIEFISPIDWTNENPTIVFNATDVEPTIKCIVDMDGNQIYNKTSSPGKIEIPLTNVLGGNHNLNITCKDWFYTSNITQGIKVDNDTPTLSIVSPSNGARIPIGSFVIAVKANDSYSGIKYIKVIFGNKGYNAIFDGKEWKVTLNPTTTGTKSIVVKTSDKVGHQTSKGIDVTLYIPSTGGGGFVGGGTGCTVVGYSCKANSDCCSGYCNAGVCANYPKDVNLSVKITPTSWEMYDNETATFTVLIENNGKDLANGVTLSLSGINGTLSESTFDLGGKTSKIVYLNVKEGIGDYIGKVSAKWGNVSDTTSFSLKVLDHNIPVESKLASSICSNASAHIINLASSGMNVSELYKEYNKAIDEMKKGNYSSARKICEGIMNIKQTSKITPPTKVTPFFIRVGNGIKDNWTYIGIATALIAGIVIWVKREAITRWYQLRKFH